MKIQHSPSLHTQALSVLREAIVVGKFKQGEHLGEPGIAELLGVSRSTARATLKELAVEGLLESKSNGRLYVRTLDLATITHIFEVRAALESLAGATIASSKGAIDLQRLYGALEGLRLSENSKVEEFLNKDIEFHRTLCELSGNEILLRAWSSIEGLIRMSILSAGIDLGRLNMAADKHKPFIDALAKHPIEAEQIIRDHIMATVPVLLNGKAIKERN